LSSAIIVGSSASTNMNNKCWNAIVNGASFGFQTSIAVDTNPMEFDHGQATAANSVLSMVYTNLPMTPPASIQSTDVDIALYKEVYDWAITSVASSTTASGYTADITTTFTENFLYGSTTLTSGSYFMLKGNIPVNTSTSLQAYFAFPQTFNGSQPFFLAKSVFLFSSLWFQQGDLVSGTAGCYVSWGWHGANLTPKTPTTQLFVTYGQKKPWSYLVFNASTTPYVAAATAGSTATTSEWQSNFISSMFAATTTPPASGTITPTIDVTSTTLGTSGPYKIVSTQMTAYQTMANWYSTGKSPVTTWMPIDITSQWGTTLTASANPPPSNSFLNVALFTSCLKWKTTLPTIKSLYTYIDIQWNFSYKDMTNRVNRFVKLYPEGGVFQDYNSKLTTASLVKANPLLIHYAYVNAATMGVCLLELDGNVITALGDSSSNTLVLWMFFGTLLETDYANAAATYPVAPLTPTINAYGLQTGLPVSKENLYYADTSMIKYSYIMGNLATPKYGAIDDLYGLPKSGNTPITVTQKSMYHIFMGSVLLLTGISSMTVTPPVTTNSVTTRPSLLIPFYCPYANDATNIRNSFQSEKVPMVFGAWMSTTSHNNISSLNKYLGYKWSTSDNQSTRYTMVLNRLYVNAIDYPNASNAFPTVKSGDGMKVPVAPFLANVTLRFNQYTKTATGNDSVLYLFNNTLNSVAQAAQYCSGHVLLINNRITIDPATTFTFGTATGLNTGVFGALDTPAPTVFYALGKPFHRAILTGLNMAYTYTNPQDTAANSLQVKNLNGNVTTFVDSTYYWTGIKRPTVETFIGFSTNDLLGYFCTSVTSDINTMVSNYIRASNAFLLDYNPDLTTAWGKAALTFDKSEAVFGGDQGSNVKLVVLPPVTLPTGSVINFTAGNSSFTSNTICGVQLATGTIVRECTSLNQNISCSTTGGTSFTICCYNLLITEPFSLATLTASFPTVLAGFVSSIQYSAAVQIAASPNPYSFATGSAATTVTSNTTATFLASITAITYTHVTQENGYGKVHFTVTLPREVTRDTKYVFSGDFSALLIPNNTPRCAVTFTTKYGSSWDSADTLIDACATTNIQNQTNPIVITTKRLVYKCGLNFTKTMTVSLWPINVVNWPVLTTNTYKISVQLISFGENLINNTVGFNMPAVTGLDAKPSVTQPDSLCTVSSVTPKLPGEFGDYTFDFDLDTNKGALTTQTPNELTIFWPYIYYGAMQRVTCWYNAAWTNCSYSDEGMLNIRFTTALPVGSGKKISIIVSNVMNPAIDTDLAFPCTVNNTNFSINKRLNLITGSGKLTGGITLTSVTAGQGALRLFSATPSLSDSNPRNAPTHTFRLTIDRGTDLTITPLTIANNPYLIVTFPQEYNLPLYQTTVKASATIDQFTNDTNNVITKTTTITPSSVTTSGNRVFIYFPAASYTLDATFRYWEIKITNIFAPYDKVMAGAYSFTLTNSNLSSLYKTHTNLNTGSYAILANNSFLTNSRGNSFDFDGSKWVIDIGAAPQLNTMTIRPGRFSPSNFFVKANSNVSAVSSFVNVNSPDPTFKFLSTTGYNVSSAQSGSTVGQQFFMGAPCGTAPGQYIVQLGLTQSSVTNWAPLGPIVVSVDSLTKATISYQTPGTVPMGGSTWVGILISEPNFDALTVAWLDGDGAKNDSTAKMTGVTIPARTFTPVASTTTVGGAVTPTVLPLSMIRCSFTITNTDATIQSQAYKTTDPNACYTWGATTTLTINISAAISALPATFDVAAAFTYFNSSTDANLPKNSIRFSMKIPNNPVYVYCALVCFNNNLPTDDVIRAPVTANTNILQYYSTVFTNPTGGQDMVFNGLIRGQKYKLRCIVETVHGNTTLRANASATWSAANGTTGADLMPLVTQTSYCAQFVMPADQGYQVRKGIVDYCQKLFSAGGFNSTGCQVCTDTVSPKNYIYPGLDLPNPSTACANAAYNTNSLRLLQTTPTTGTTTPTTGTTTPTTTPAVVEPGIALKVNATISLLNVCAVQHYQCATDMTGTKLQPDIFTQMKTDLGTQDNIKKFIGISSVNVTTINLYNDLTIPDITKLSITALSAAATGVVTFTATHPSPLRCNYQVTPTTPAPTFDSVAGCTSATLCGIVNPNPYGITVSTNSTGAVALTAGTLHYVYFACTNDIPFSTKRANVTSSTFTSPGTATSGGTTTPATSTATPGTSTATPSTTTPGAGSFINMSLLTILLLVSLIL
jgi:hypothetical protein